MQRDPLVIYIRDFLQPGEAGVVTATSTLTSL
jgi:hypothetical protein